MKLCNYCKEREGKYIQTSGKFCCEPHYNSCPAVLSKIKQKNKKKKPTKIIRPKPDVCDYCKENPPIFYFKTTNKWCCEKNARTCLKKKRLKERKRPKPNFCEYGCGEQPNFYIKTSNKWCCSKNVRQCPEQRRLNSIRTTIAMNKTEVRQKNSEAQKRLWNDPNSSYNSKTRSKKISESLTGKTYNTGRKLVEDFQKDFPLFCKVEEIRNHPKTQEIQVHCKNHLCKNSKEKDGWFTPNRSQLYDRIWALENDDGNDQRFFYCSEICKQTCPLYSFRVDIFFKTPSPKLPYTQSEYNTWRLHVLESDDYTCVYCGETAEHAHHIQPIKLEPSFSLDPDNGISVCSTCHFKYAHKDECSTGNLAKIKCKKQSA